MDVLDFLNAATGAKLRNESKKLSNTRAFDIEEQLDKYKLQKLEIIETIYKSYKMNKQYKEALDYAG